MSTKQKTWEVKWSTQFNTRDELGRPFVRSFWHSQDCSTKSIALKVVAHLKSIGVKDACIKLYAESGCCTGGACVRHGGTVVPSWRRDFNPANPSQVARS